MVWGLSQGGNFGRKMSLGGMRILREHPFYFPPPPLKFQLLFLTLLIIITLQLHYTLYLHCTTLCIYFVLTCLLSLLSTLHCYTIPNIPPNAGYPIVGAYHIGQHTQHTTQLDQSSIYISPSSLLSFFLLLLINLYLSYTTHYLLVPVHYYSTYLLVLGGHIIRYTHTTTSHGAMIIALANILHCQYWYWLGDLSYSYTGYQIDF